MAPLLLCSILAAAVRGAALASSPSYPVTQLLYSLPPSLQLDNASIVRVNPSGPSSNIHDTTLVDVWRLGDGVLHNVSSWDVSAVTGAGLSPTSARALLPAAIDSSAIQYGDGVFGASLNMFTNALQPGATLGTITIENNWSPPTRVAPWSGAASALALSLEYQCPTASRTGVAVYSSWSLGIAHVASGDFLWYETTLFDLHRPLGGDEIWMDTISGNLIIHAPLTAAPSAFHTLAPGSAVASSEPWAGFRAMAFTIDAVQVHNALVAANLKFNRSLDVDVRSWVLVHFNVELEGTSDSRAGHALRNLRIEWNA